MEDLTKSINELTVAIQNYNGKTAIDYLLIAIPIIVSILAIIISLRISHQQNKIALFEKRFSVFACMQKCVVFDRMLENLEKPRDAYEAYCRAFGVEQSSLRPDDGWATLEYRQIEDKLMQGFLLFDYIDDETIKRCCDALLQVLKDIEAGKDISAAKANYHTQAASIYKAIPQIQDILSLKRRKITR